MESALAEAANVRAACLTYVLITPAQNEAAFIEQTIKAVVGQTARPAKWLIVSDGSTDCTDDIVKAYAAKHNWIELMRIGERRERHFAGKANAFNTGYARLTDLDYDVIGNLDADITFEADYFAFLLAKFRENPGLGVAGTPFREGLQQYDYRFTNIEHVSGACQMFRRECFEEIGGYVPIKIGGIDLVAVLSARMKGWQTRTFPEKACVHHRKLGTAKQNALMVAFRGGRGDCMLGGHPVWEVFRCMYQMTRQPLLLGGCLRLAGFVWAMVSRVEKAVPADLVQFRRAEQMTKLRNFAKRLIPPRSSKSRTDIKYLRTNTNDQQHTVTRQLTYVLRTRLRHTLTKKLQKIFWVYLTRNFVITSMNNFTMTEPANNCAFIPITLANCCCVRDFREEHRVSEYRQKLAHKEIGFFAEIDGRMVGSIWATINRAQMATVVRTYMTLRPKEALIHDIVTGDHFRGMGIGPFVVGRMASILLNGYGVSRIIIDVNVRNRPSLRMMDKAGLQMSEQMLYISAFGKLMLQKSLRLYRCS